MAVVPHELNDMELTKKELMLIGIFQLVLMAYGYIYSGYDTSIP